MTSLRLLLQLSACGVALGEAPGPDDSAESSDRVGDTGPEHILNLDAGPGDFLYQSDVMLDFGLTLTEEAMAALTASPRDDVHGTFTFRDEVYDVGVHLKGSASYTDFTEKPSLKIDFHQWSPEQTFHGVKRLTLNSMWQDASMLAEHTTYALFAQMERPGPRHGYARVSINGEWYGLYGIVETMDEQFVDRWWDHDDLGNLYEGHASGDIKPSGVDNFIDQEIRAPADRSDLEALADAFDGATPSTFTEVLGQQFELEAALDYFAIDMIVSNDDGYVSDHHNYLLYHAPIAGKWWFVPWGMDQSWEVALPLWAEVDSVLSSGCLAAPDCKAAVEARVAVILDTLEAEDLAGEIAAEGERILPICEEDPRARHHCEEAVADVVRAVAERPAQLR